MENTGSFGKWFRPLIESSGLKMKAVAEAAEIDPVSLSRILNGAQGVKKETAVGLAKALNRLAGRELADENVALRLAVGFSAGASETTGKPQNVAEFIKRLSDMGFDIQLSVEELEGMGPDDLQDTIDQIEANLLVKARRKRA